jgi:hypothetical protein
LRLSRGRSGPAWPAGLRISVTRPCLRPTTTSAREATAEKIGWVREGAGDRFGDIELEIAAYFIAISEDPAEAVAAMARRFGVPDAVLAEHPHALIGSVPDICDQLERRRGELGVSYINVAQRSMEAFAPVVARLAGR